MNPFSSVRDIPVIVELPDMLNPISLIELAKKFQFDSKSICHYDVHIYEYEHNGLLGNVCVDCSGESNSRVNSLLLLTLHEKYPEWKIGFGVGFTYNGHSIVYSSSPLPLTNLGQCGRAFLSEDITFSNPCVAGSKKFCVTLTLISVGLHVKRNEYSWGMVSEEAILTAVNSSILSFACLGVVQDEPEWFVVGSTSVFNFDGMSSDLAQKYFDIRSYYAGLKICLGNKCLVSDTRMLNILILAGGYSCFQEMLEDSLLPGGICLDRFKCLNKEIANSTVYLTHMGFTQLYKGVGPPAYSDEGAFIVRGGLKLTVDEYFKQKCKIDGSVHAKALPGGGLVYPSLPLINIGSRVRPTYVPSELLIFHFEPQDVPVKFDLDLHPLQALEAVIGYRFQQLSVLAEAVTHPSYLGDNRRKTLISNQRLEFLGDAVLQLIISDWLFSLFPMENEGQLSKRRATMVKGVFLVKIARVMRLDRYIRLGFSEDTPEGRNRATTLEDATEAVIGAVYIDGGYKAAYNVIKRLYSNFDKELENNYDTFNPKGQLLEYIQAKHGNNTILRYEVTNIGGTQHTPIFEVTTFLHDTVLGRGTGNNKRQAEEEAAKASILQGDYLIHTEDNEDIFKEEEPLYYDPSFDILLTKARLLALPGNPALSSKTVAVWDVFFIATICLGETEISRGVGDSVRQAQFVATRVALKHEIFLTAENTIPTITAKIRLDNIVVNCPENQATCCFSTNEVKSDASTYFETKVSLASVEIGRGKGTSQLLSEEAAAQCALSHAIILQMSSLVVTASPKKVDRIAILRKFLKNSPVGSPKFRLTKIIQSIYGDVLSFKMDQQQRRYKCTVYMWDKEICFAFGSSKHHAEDAVALAAMTVLQRSDTVGRKIEEICSKKNSTEKESVSKKRRLSARDDPTVKESGSKRSTNVATAGHGYSHNPKGRLLEIFQPIHGNSAIRYVVSDRIIGTALHAPSFECTVFLLNEEIGRAIGSSKKGAMEAGARAALLHNTVMLCASKKSIVSVDRNSKGKLNEYVQLLHLPGYPTLRFETIPSKNGSTFESTIFLRDKEVARAVGRSKKIADTEAARIALLKPEKVLVDTKIMIGSSGDVQKPVHKEAMSWDSLPDSTNIKSTLQHIVQTFYGAHSLVYNISTIKEGYEVTINMLGLEIGRAQGLSKKIATDLCIQAALTNDIILKLIDQKDKKECVTTATLFKKVKI